jgi:hypothetical protein
MTFKFYYRFLPAAGCGEEYESEEQNGRGDGAAIGF